MRSTTCVSLLGLVAAAAAAPLASGSCSSPGALVCNGKGQFGICDLNNQAVWIGVAQGTECVCSGASCSIAAAGADAPAQQPATVPSPQQPAAQPTAGTPAPAASSQAAAAPPATPAKAPPASSASAPAAQSSLAAADPPIQHGTTNSDSGSSSNQATGDASITSYRKTFTGTGSTSDGWPAESAWVNFESMWDENLKNVISQSCAGFGASPNNSPQESADLKSAIQSVAQQSGVDERYILAIVMQESNGCVRVPTTNYGVNNPGLMQSHNGAHSCAGKTPCPSSEITGMIQDGVMGTADGDGLKQLLAKAGGSGVQSFYMAARMYNSGSIAPSGQLQDGIATHCYVTDIANRLLGWSAGPSSCSS